MMNFTEEDFMKSYTERIKYLRENNDLTQRDVAEYLAISTQKYKNYEKGICSISASHLISLCLLYNVSADYILGFTDKQGRII